VMRQGFLDLSKLLQRYAEIVVRQGIAGIDGEEFAIEDNGHRRLATRAQCIRNSQE
jgi:hypothetical protein